jgi:cytoskeletal protein RodZ
MPASDRDEALRELGRMAMEKREDLGLSLEDIFERTRVRVEFLRGIEQGAYQGFPDLVYVKGFVRTYLSVIGAEELKDEFMSWLNKDGPSKDRRITPNNVLGNTTYPTKGFKLASHFWLFAVLFMVMAGSGWYVWYSWSNNPEFPRFDQTQQNGAVFSDDEDSADVFPLSSDNSIFALATPGSASEDETEPEPVAPYLHIKADKTDVWVEVTIGGRVVMSRTMGRGSEASWDLPSRARVRYGRSNAATVVLNGRELVNGSGRGTFTYDPDGTFGRAQ